MDSDTPPIREWLGSISFHESNFDFPLEGPAHTSSRFVTYFDLSFILIFKSKLPTSTYCSSPCPTSYPIACSKRF